VSAGHALHHNARQAERMSAAVQSKGTKHFARTNGRDDVHKLDHTDILTLNDDVARYTEVEHV
jgi:hypothetical protein